VIDKLEVVNTRAVAWYFNGHGATPLFMAANGKQADCVKLLLQNGADANLATTVAVGTHEYPLHAALRNNAIE